MKRAIVLFLWMALLLGGCASEPQQSQEPYTSVINGVSYYVNPEAQTITAQGHEYYYRYIDHDDRRGVSITYPNGTVVTDSYSTSSGMGGVSFSSMDMNGYADCYDLLDVVPEQVQEEEKGEMIQLIFLGIPLIGLGWWEAACPDTHWNWMYGWRYRNAEPSDEALGRIMAVGYLEIAFGVILILIGIFA